MIYNRSVPPTLLLPHLCYQDVGAATVWLTETFGFVEHYRYGDPISGAQMYFGGAWFMLHQGRPGVLSPAQLGYGTQNLTVFIEDVDGHFERTKAAGANIVEDLHETEYGERQYGVKDLDGHLWLFSRHVQDLSPADWGAQIADR